MLCENCPALRCEGYEYPEEYCIIQAEEDIRDLKNGTGCCLRAKTIQRRVKKIEEMEALHYDGLAKSYALDCLEKKTAELSEYINDLKECIGLFDYNCPKPTKRGQKSIYSLIRNKRVLNREIKEYKRYRELELCGLIDSDISRENDYDPFNKPDMEEHIAFWLTKDGFKWLSEHDSCEDSVVEYKFLQGPVVHVSVEGKKQAEAYAVRDKIKVGERFVWRRSKICRTDYITSGKLKDRYTYSPDFPYTDEGILEVYKIYEGENGYGPFVDYYLKVPNESEEMYHIIINGVDAMKMKRTTEEF